MKLAKILLIFIITFTNTSCGIIVKMGEKLVDEIETNQIFNHGQHGGLSDEEQEWLKIAWTYFENNYNSQTGLTSDINKSGIISMWGLSDYLAALTVAKDFNLIDSKTFDTRFSEILKFLNTMPLSLGKLPGKLYSNINGKMVDYLGQESDMGWSALDVGRLLIWLKIIGHDNPQYKEYIEKAVSRWNFCEIIDKKGSLFGANAIYNQDSKTYSSKLYQEGRLGYEEYAAMGFKAWGFDTYTTSLIEPYETKNIFDVEILVDARDVRKDRVSSHILAMPYFMHGLEFNWDKIDDNKSFDSKHTNTMLKNMSDNIALVQQKRHEQKGIFTARSEFRTNKKPYIVFNSIFANGYAWNVISDAGEYHPELALLSTKTAFALWILYPNDYTEKLMEIVKYLYDKNNGFWEGRYEATGYYEKTITSSTNSLILESLYYKKNGKIYSHESSNSYIESKLKNNFEEKNNCFPVGN